MSRAAPWIAAAALVLACGPVKVLPPAEVTAPRKRPTAPPLAPAKGQTVLAHEPVPYGEKLLEAPKPEAPADDGGLRELGVTSAETNRPDAPPVPEQRDLVALAPPSPPTADAPPLVHGAYRYALHCATCHGAAGKGDGPSAAGLLYPPSDLTRIAERRGGLFVASDVAAHVDGRVAHPSHGPADAPLWGDALRAEAETANLVRFLESLQIEIPPPPPNEDVADPT